MKTFLAVFTVCAAAVLSASEPEKAPPRMPDEVPLVSGRVLRRVQVVRWEHNRVVLRHTGGVDPIAFSLVAEPLRSQLPAIREGELKKFESDRSTAREERRTLHGQLYIVTKGAGSYKFSGTKVWLYPIEVFEQAKSDVRWRLETKKDTGVALAWVEALEHVEPKVTTTTDADGKFSINLPLEGRYFLFACGQRLLGRNYETTLWAMPVYPKSDALLLTQDNEWLP